MEPAIADSYRYCSDVARREARNFYLAFRFLPAAGRRSMCALYAFMRHTDDLADNGGSVTEKTRALSAWRRDVEASLEGNAAAWPGLLAVADTVSRYDIPRGLLNVVIQGVEMDVQPRYYATFEELADYCYHVASAVGLCCIHIWGYKSDGGRAEQLAESCGIALQLTNILRDVREDAQAGRIYLPQDELARFGVGQQDLQADRPSVGLRELLAFEAGRAYRYYDQSQALVSLVSPIGRPVFLTIVGVYRALLDEISRRDFNVLEGRVTIPRWRKGMIALRAFPHRFWGRGISEARLFNL
jgi:phytoene synthase